MDAREITTLMHRLFRGDIPQADGWVHLMIDGVLDRDCVESFISDYIRGEELLLFVDAQHCTFSSKANAFHHIENLLAHGTIRIADPKFQARIVIHPIGVGVGNVP